MSDIPTENAPTNSSVWNPDCLDLCGYLLPLGSRDKLYDYPSICLFLYRELPLVARTYVMRMLFLDTPIPRSELSRWITPLCAKEQELNLRLLTDLDLWCNAPGVVGALELNPIFKRNLKISIFSESENTHYVLKKLTSSDKTLDIAELGEYAVSRWSAILHYMIDPAEAQLEAKGECVSWRTVRSLLHANLISSKANNGHTITRRGLQFLLNDTKSQTWPFLLAYMQSCSETDLSLPDSMALLFQLNTAEVGRAYSSEYMSAEMLAFLRELNTFGFIYQVKPGDDYFYPTILTKSIANGDNPSPELNSEQSCKILVETNFRFYVYTNSSLHLSIVDLFGEMLRRFPRLIEGIVTRESVRRAMRRGVHVDQIIAYLERHAHPIMGGSLPASFKDQLQHWQNERRCLKSTEGTLFNNFEASFEYEALRDYAQSNDALLWENSDIQAILVAPEKSDIVAAFLAELQGTTTR